MSVELSAEAKEAIRNYILKMVAIPGSVVTIVSLIAGYFIHEVGEGRAYTKALQEVSGIITQDARSIGRALEAADAQKRQIDADAERIRAMAVSIQTDAAVVKAERDVNGVVNALKDDSGFIATVTAKANADVISKLGSINNRFAFDRNVGVKLCAVVAGGNNTDVSTLPAWATPETCRGIARMEGAGETPHMLGCFHSDGAIVWGSGASLNPAVPTRNCGWR